MGEIDHPEHAEHDRQSKRSDHQDRPKGDPGKKLHDDQRQVHRSRLQVAWPSSLQLRSMSSEPVSLARIANRSLSFAMADFFLDSSTSTDCTDWWSHLR